MVFAAPGSRPGANDPCLADAALLLMTSGFVTGIVPEVGGDGPTA
jgi:hypothetical protein